MFFQVFYVYHLSSVNNDGFAYLLTMFMSFSTYFTVIARTSGTIVNTDCDSTTNQSLFDVGGKHLIFKH